MKKFTLKENTSFIFPYKNTLYQMNLNINEGICCMYRLVTEGNSYREVLINVWNDLYKEVGIIEGVEVIKRLEVEDNKGEVKEVVKEVDKEVEVNKEIVKEEVKEKVKKGKRKKRQSIK